MKTFDIHRFWNVVKWDITYHRSHIVKSLLTTFAIFFVAMLFFGSVIGQDTNGIRATGSFLWYGSLALMIYFSGSFILYHVKTKQQRLDLLMLPASNLEKFVVRYLSASVVNIAVIFLSFFAADVLQYLVMLVLHPERALFVESVICKTLSSTELFVFFGDLMKPALAYVALMWWYHSLYLLGGVVFRKLAWLWTTLIQILFFNVFVVGFNLLMVSFLESFDIADYLVARIDAWGSVAIVLYYALVLGFTVLNYYLSYRIFSRMQLIHNKWTNL